MNNVQVSLDTKNFLAKTATSDRTILIDLRLAVVNFVVLGKIFNLSMKNEDEGRAFMLFMHLLDKNEISAIIDGEYTFHNENPLIGTVIHHTSRMVIIDNLTPFWAVMFRIFLPLRENGWLPFTVPSAT